MYVTDLNGNEYTLQATSTNEGEVNSNQSFSCEIKFNKVNDLFIHNIDKMWLVTDLDDVTHRIIYVSKKGEGNSLTVSVKAIPLFFDVLDNDRIYERHDGSMTAQNAFTLIFNNTGFTFNLVDNFLAVSWEGFGDGESKLSSFKRCLDRYRCEFRISGNIVFIEKQVGNDTNIMYRYKLNASNIVLEADASQLWTFARGYGDYPDGDDGGWEQAKLIREYISPLASLIGVRHAPPIKDGRVKLSSQMDAQLKTLVDESLKISVSADIHDLRKQNYPIGQSQLGDRVFLIDERIGLDEEIRVISQSITRDYLGNVLDINITFGADGLTKRHQAKINSAIDSVNGIMAGTTKIPFDALDNAVLQATAALLSAQTELEFENGILAIDKNNPNNVVIYNSAGFGISTDGGTTVDIAMTAAGIVANAITSGQINANNVSIGNNKIQLNNSGLFVYKNNVIGASLVEGNLTFYDQTTGDQIGQFAATVWSDSTTKGISMNMESERYISFGYFVDPVTGYTPMMLLNPGDNMAGEAKGIHMNIPIRMNDDVWMGVNGLRFGENNTHNHSALWAGGDGSAVLAGYTGIRLAYLTTGGVINDRLTVDSNSVDCWQDLDMHGWKILRVAEVQQSSSVLLKTNIQDYTDNALDIINNLRVKKFHFQSDVDQGEFSNEQLGLLSELSPEVANKDQTAIRQTKIVHLHTKSIQELSVQLDDLKKENDDFKILIGQLSEENDNLKRSIDDIVNRLAILEA